jgi:predicted molibdopterin-dependent oxidoreductase YjgC
MGSARVPEETRQAAEWFARAERAVILLSPICGQGDQERKNAASVITLAAITGHLGKTGSGILPLFARCNVRGACDMGVAPDRLPGYALLNAPQAHQHLQTIWGKDLPSAPGLDAEGMIQSVSGLICVADDPPAVLPMGTRAMAPLSKIEFLVVLDSFLTPTTRIAHVLLPIASFAETDGTITNFEGRTQTLNAASAPPSEARKGWEVLAELCRRFGVDAFYSSAMDVRGESDRCVTKHDLAQQHVKENDEEDRSDTSFRPKCRLRGTTATTLTSSERPEVLARDGSYDWGRDPLVCYSPTLNRDYLSLQKLFPNGFVEICKQDVDRFGVHAGRRVKLSSAHGDAVIPVRVRTDLKPGVLLVPYAFRDCVSNVLGADGVTAVKVEQA